MLPSEPAARVFLADEHPIFLAGLRSCLASQPGIDVIGETHSSAQVVGAIDEAAPDIAVVGISFGGVSVIETVLASLSHTRVIAVAEEHNGPRVKRLLSLGARGYLLKHSSAPVLARAIAMVLRGGCFVDSGGAALVTTGQPAGAAPRKSTLTEREQAVLRLIALGFSSREAADRIGITVKSAETYKARASTKLEIDSRWKIVQYGISQGWFR